MMPKTTEKVLRRVESLVKDMLAERYGDEDMVFDPIVAIPRVDHDGLEYVRIYIGFEGDETRLDANWTGRMSGKILSQFTEDEMFRVPDKSFVSKSDWDGDNWDEFIQGLA